MERNGKKITGSGVSKKTLLHLQKYQQLAETAVEKEQAENHRLGIPNWHSVNGKITNDQESVNGFKDKSERRSPRKASDKLTRPR
jgi:hypothetical protein